MIRAKQRLFLGLIECILALEDSGHLSGLPRGDILTSATDKRMRSSTKIG